MKAQQGNIDAAKRAEAYAPRPTGGHIMAGLAVGGAAMIGDVIASRFYGWAWQDHILVTAAVTALGFLVGLVSYERLVRQNDKAYLRETDKPEESSES